MKCANVTHASFNISAMVRQPCHLLSCRQLLRFKNWTGSRVCALCMLGSQSAAHSKGPCARAVSQAPRRFVSRGAPGRTAGVQEQQSRLHGDDQQQGAGEEGTSTTRSGARNRKKARGPAASSGPKVGQQQSTDWRALMEPTRRAAASLCAQGVLQATQKGQVGRAQGVLQLASHPENVL